MMGSGMINFGSQHTIMKAHRFKCTKKPLLYGPAVQLVGFVIYIVAIIVYAEANGYIFFATFLFTFLSLIYNSIISCLLYMSIKKEFSKKVNPSEEPNVFRPYAPEVGQYGEAYPQTQPPPLYSAQYPHGYEVKEEDPKELNSIEEYFKKIYMNEIKSDDEFDKDIEILP